VTLPFVERRAASRSGPNPAGHRPPGSPAPEAPVSPAPARPAGRRVLLVDDEDAIRTAMRRALERRGWVVDEAADGREALLKLDVGGRPGPYDAVVTDLRMPGITGMEVCERLTAMHPGLAARTVVITGDSASPAVATFLATAGKPFLQKPFDLRALAELLERVVTEPHPVK
jgi:CheY-like chemotaxis protein